VPVVVGPEPSPYTRIHLGPTGGVVILHVNHAEADVNGGSRAQQVQYVGRGVQRIHDTTVVRRHSDRAAPVRVVQTGFELAKAREETPTVVDVIVDAI